LEPINLADDGFVDVTIDGVTQKLDLFEINNEFFAIREKLKETNEQNAAFVELIKSKGFPSVSHKLAIDLVDAIYERIDSLKKKPSDTPGSPGFMG